MALTNDDFDRIARLARLRPTADEKRKLLSDLNKILEYLEVIDEVDIKGVKEMLDAAPQEAPFREDIVRAGLSQNDALLNTLLSQSGSSVVPEVVEKPDSSE